MKITKQVALLAVLAVSILPGCGKKNGDGDNPISGVPGYSYVPGTANGAGGCVQFAVTSGAFSFPIAGQAQIGITGFSANATVGGSGYTSGNYYFRRNGAGDEIRLVLNGSPNSTGSIVATVTLSQMTVLALGGHIQPICVQSVSFQNTGITAGSPGYLYGGMVLYTNMGAVSL